MLYVCISFDYELFMGENRLPEQDVLFTPGEKLGKALKELGVSATFFADVCCPAAYRRFGKTTVADEFGRKLVELSTMGHDIQLHIHPHWEKATQVGQKVEFPREAYRIHHWAELKPDYSEVQNLIRNGREYLEEMISPVVPDYKCVAFRAGGYCLQPEKQFADVLFREGIRIDSSVCRGLSFDGDGMYYNYRNNPQKNNVYIGANYGLEDNMLTPVPGCLLEVPVAGYSTFPYRPIASKLRKPMPSTSNRGSTMSLHVPSAASGKLGPVERIKRIIHSSNMLSFDSQSAESMSFMLKRLAREEGKDGDCYIATIAHPKLMSDVHIENMKRVIRSLQGNKNIKFITMRGIADQLEM